MSENQNQGKKPPRPTGQRADHNMNNGTRPGGAPRQGAPKRPAAQPSGQAPMIRGGAQNTAHQAPKNAGGVEPIIRNDRTAEQPAQRQPQRNGANAAPAARRAAPGQRPPQRQGQRPMPRRGAPQQPETGESFATTVKGVIAVAITCFAVCVIVIMFSNSLFVSDAELQKTAKTGHLTETAFEVIEPKQQLRDEVVTTKATKKKKTTTVEEEDEPEEDNTDLPESLDTSIAGEYTVNSPVYLHPIADANSANLATLPYGAEIKVLGQSFGWYYLEYEGQKGYAWGTFFNKK